MKKELQLDQVLMLGMLIAIQLILGRFAIGYRVIRFDFAFVTTFLMGKWFGAKWTGIACGITDVISSLLINGTGYYVQFTVSAVLTGLITGWFFYRKPVSWRRVIIYQLLISVLINAAMNTYWIMTINQLPFQVILWPRLIKELISTPVQIIVLHIIGNSQGIREITDRYFE